MPARCAPAAWSMISASSSQGAERRLGSVKNPTLLRRRYCTPQMAEGHRTRSAKAMNYYQRNFMQYLRKGNWVSIAALPDAPSTKSKLVKLGWVERRGRGPE